MLRPLGELGPPGLFPVLWLGKGPWSVLCGETGSRKSAGVQSKLVSYLRGKGWTGDGIWAVQDRAVPRWVMVARSGSGYLGISAS